MNKYWFKPKAFGYGFTPTTWEGWFATLGILGVLLLSAYSHSFFTLVGPSFEQAAGFLVDVVLIAIATTVLFTPRTEGKLKWNWGKRR